MLRQDSRGRFERTPRQDIPGQRLEQRSVVLNIVVRERIEHLLRKVPHLRRPCERQHRPVRAEIFVPHIFAVPRTPGQRRKARLVQRDAEFGEPKMDLADTHRLRHIAGTQRFHNMLQGDEVQTTVLELRLGCEVAAAGGDVGHQTVGAG